MKNMLLILSILFLFTGCNEEETKQQDDLITENAIIYYDSSGIDNCTYTFKTENSTFYTVENLNEKFKENDLKVKISYIKTEKTLNCGFSGNLILILIEKIEKI